MSSSPEPGRVSELPPGLGSLWRTFMFGYRAEPRLLSMSLLMVLFMALPDALIALWLKWLADAVAQRDAGTVLYAALGLATSATLTWALGVYFDRVQRRFRDRLSIALEAHVARLQASIATIEHHEQPELLDRLQVLRDHVFALDHLFMSVFTTLGWLLRLAVSLVLLGSIHPALLLLALFALPIVLVAAWRPARERAAEEQAAEAARLARHLFVLGTTASPAKEVRVMRLAERLERERRAAYARWYAPVASSVWHSALFHALAWALFGVAFTGALAWVALGLASGPGAVLLMLVAGSRLSMYVGAVVGELGFLRGIWLDSARRLCWLEDYAHASRAKRDLPVPMQLEQGIRLCHVSFRYPGTSKLALEDVSLELCAGKVIALVGENGAGKTTLVKLLCGMYAPSSGQIEVDGQPLAGLPVEGWRARLAGAFQDFFRFELRAQHSIGLGELARLDERPATLRASERAGAGDVLDKLPRGLDTQLGPRWDEGQELSFGQWQKLALARGLMRESPLLLVLDEPTAALDAETEHALFERFARASRQGADAGRITLLVSHRFSTVRMADQIVVLDGARVVEVGSHDALLAQGGQYAQLYGLQAAAFR